LWQCHPSLVNGDANLLEDSPVALLCSYIKNCGAFSHDLASPTSWRKLHGAKVLKKSEQVHWHAPQQIRY
jgi:hypothetical protein